MSKKDKNINDKLYKEYKVKKIGLNTQFTLMIVLIILLVLRLFNPFFKAYYLLALAINLLVIAYNNHTIYKRKYFTLLYLIVGLISLIIFFVEVFK